MDMQAELFTQKLDKKDVVIKSFPYQYASEAVTEFEKDCRLIGLTRGQFSLIDLIVALLDKTGPAHVVCCTWSAGIKDAKQSKALLNSGKILSFMLVTDHSYSLREKKYAISLTGFFGEENIRTSSIHAKFILIHNDIYNVCIRTSMNLNANKKCENYEIDDDKIIFDFYMDFIQKTFDIMPNGFVPGLRIVGNAMNEIMGARKNKKVENEFAFARDGFNW